MVCIILIWKSIGSLMAVNHDLFSRAINWVPQLALYFLYPFSRTEGFPGMLCLDSSLIPTFMAVPVVKKGKMEGKIQIKISI